MFLVSGSDILQAEKREEKLTAKCFLRAEEFWIGKKVFLNVACYSSTFASKVN